MLNVESRRLCEAGVGGRRDCGPRALEKMHSLGLSLPRTGMSCCGARRVPALDTYRLVLSASVPEEWVHSQDTVARMREVRALFTSEFSLLC